MSIYSVLLMVIMNLDISNSEFKTIVHDSVMALPVPVARLAYTAGSEFRWASDGSYGYDDFSIFKNRSHLSLNWEDTKAFQNPNYKKFDKVQSITDKYMKDPNAKNAIYPAMLTDPYVLGMLEYYKYQKDLGTPSWHRHIPILSFEDRNVLMANEDGKRIAIQDYLTWLSCNYQLDLTVGDKLKDKQDISRLNEAILCSQEPLQNYLTIQKQGVHGWLFLLLTTMGLFSCSTGRIIPTKKTSLEIEFATRGTKEYNKSVVIVKNNDVLTHCNMHPKNNTPYVSWDLICGKGLSNKSSFTIQYAIIPWEKDKAWTMGHFAYRELQANKLPPSAWRTYTIYPKQLLEQGRAMPAKGMPASHWHKTRVTVTLYIDSDGKVSQEIKREYVKVGNPYA